MNNLIKGLLLTILCFLGWKISFFFSLPAVQASVISPHSGIALAGILILGYRFWPAVWIAVFLALLTSGLEAQDSLSAGGFLFFIACRATSAIIQVLIAAFLVRHFMKPPYAMEKEEDIVKFLFVAGSVSSLAGSFLSTGVFYSFGIIKTDIFALRCLISWVGHILGVLIFAPLMMVFIGQPREVWSSRLRTVAFPVMIIFTLILVFFVYVKDQANKRSVKELALKSELIANKIKNHMDSYFQELYSLQGLYRSSVDVDRSEFKSFTRDLLKRGSILAYSWHPKVLPSEKEAFKERMRAELKMPFDIKFSPFNGTDPKTVAVSVHYPLAYIEPFNKYGKLAGIDIALDAKLLPAFDLAASSQELILSEPFYFKDDIQAVAAVLPVHENALAQSGVSDLKGFIVLFINAENLIYRDLKPFLGKDTFFDVFDKGIAGQGKQLYKKAFEGDVNEFLKTGADMSIANRSWRLDHYQLRRSLDINKEYSIHFIMAVIFFFLACLEIFLLIITGRQTLIKRLVLEKTQDLNKANELLQSEIIEKNKIAQDLERSNKELEQFAYVASHDLQEPLRMVASFTGLLEVKYKDKLDDTAREYIHFAVDGARRMQQLIDDLLEFSRVGQKDVPKEDVDLNKVCAQILQDCAVSIKENRATVLIEALPRIHANETQMRQLFLNLISNGIKYKSSRDPVIRVSCKQLSSFEWQFSVADNGIGIHEKNLDKLFVIFKRLHTKEEYKGTGIGLALCKKIVENYGGRIWVESVVDAGTTFNFILNVKRIF